MLTNANISKNLLITFFFINFKKIKIRYILIFTNIDNTSFSFKFKRPVIRALYSIYRAFILNTRRICSNDIIYLCKIITNNKTNSEKLKTNKNLAIYNSSPDSFLLRLLKIMKDINYYTGLQLITIFFFISFKTY
jgi:hypothetical protein